jgi:hypothetical protein
MEWRISRKSITERREGSRWSQSLTGGWETGSVRWRDPLAVAAGLHHGSISCPSLAGRRHDFFGRRCWPCCGWDPLPYRQMLSFCPNLNRRRPTRYHPLHISRSPRQHKCRATRPRSRRRSTVNLDFPQAKLLPGRFPTLRPPCPGHRPARLKTSLPKFVLSETGELRPTNS